MYHLISQLASQITADFGTGTSSPVFIGVANGAFIFIADLLRKINLPVSVDFIRDDSYDSGTLSNGVPKISLDLKLDIQGKHVILEYILNALSRKTVLLAERERERSGRYGCHGCKKGPGYATPLDAMAGPKESLIYVTCLYAVISRFPKAAKAKAN